MYTLKQALVCMMEGFDCIITMLQFIKSWLFVLYYNNTVRNKITVEMINFLSGVQVKHVKLAKPMIHSNNKINNN